MRKPRPEKCKCQQQKIMGRGGLGKTPLLPSPAPPLLPGTRPSQHRSPCSGGRRTLAGFDAGRGTTPLLTESSAKESDAKYVPRALPAFNYYQLQLSGWIWRRQHKEARKLVPRLPVRQGRELAKDPWRLQRRGSCLFSCPRLWALVCSPAFWELRDCGATRGGGWVGGGWMDGWIGWAGGWMGVDE